MKIDVYKVINEAKENKSYFSEDEVRDLYSKEAILFKLLQSENEEDKNINKFIEEVLKKRQDYTEGLMNDDLSDLVSDINTDFKKIIKSNRKEEKNSLLDRIKNMSDAAMKYIETAKTSPDTIIYKLFLDEYNNKYAFTWKAFKYAKKRYEKSHPLFGENVSNLKSMLERDSKIVKINNNTLFCRSAKTLSDTTLEKIRDRISSEWTK